MSYDRSRGLLVNESQYSMKDDNGKKHVPFQGYQEFGDGKPLSDDERSRAEEIAKELYTSSRASYPDYMEPIDFSDIKTDAFYDHMMNTLGKLYKQEESGDSVVLDEQEEKKSNVMTTKDLMGETGWFDNYLGLDFTKFGYRREGVKGVVDALDGVVRTSDLKLTLKTLEGLKGKSYKDDTQDPPVMISAIKQFTELYKEDEGGDELASDVDSVGTMTLETGAEDLKKKIINLIKSGSNEVPQQSQSNTKDDTPKEPNTDPLDIEKIKSGEQFLKKGQGNESSDTVKEVQALLKTKMEALGVNIDFKQLDLGNYGPKTAGLITAFQSINNLKPDGIVGAKTIAALMG